MNAAGTREDIRCPSCARLLVLRSGPAITTHYAHRPRQSCRRRPGRPAVTPLRLEQLSLFELETVAAPEPLAWPEPWMMATARGAALRVPVRTPSPTPVGRPVRPVRRRGRRRAWLPRVIRWLKSRSG